MKLLILQIVNEQLIKVTTICSKIVGLIASVFDAIFLPFASQEQEHYMHNQKLCNKYIYFKNIFGDIKQVNKQAIGSKQTNK